MDLASIRCLKDESSSGLRDLLNQITRSREALRVLEQPVNNWNAWFIFFAARRMEMTTRREWHRWMKTKKAPSPINIWKSLQKTIQTLMTLDIACGSDPDAPASRSKPPQEATHSSRVLTISSSNSSWQVCHKSHHLGRCDEFKRMTTVQRWTLANRSRFCYNRVRSWHNVQNYDTSYHCREYDRRHHSVGSCCVSLLSIGEREEERPYCPSGRSRLQAAVVKESLACWCSPTSTTLYLLYET